MVIEKQVCRWKDYMERRAEFDFIGVTFYVYKKLITECDRNTGWKTRVTHCKL